MTPISVIIPSLVLFLIYTTKMNEEIPLAPVTTAGGFLQTFALITALVRSRPPFVVKTWSCRVVLADDKFVWNA